jgi:hypothetical protein
MKQYDYKSVVIRPRLETFEDWLEKHIKESWNWYTRDETFEQYREKRLSECGWERLYWDTRSGSKWFVFFPNGRIVKMSYKKCTETWADFEARVDKVIARVEKESKGRYAEFSNLMQRIVSERIKDYSYLTYPTTYGFGLEAIFNWNFDKQATEIEALLNEMGVDYTTEYLDARWVFRYKISKAAENQKLIENLLKKSN